MKRQKQQTSLLLSMLVALAVVLAACEQQQTEAVLTTMETEPTQDVAAEVQQRADATLTAVYAESVVEDVTREVGSTQTPTSTTEPPIVLNISASEGDEIASVSGMTLFIPPDTLSEDASVIIQALEPDFDTVPPMRGAASVGEYYELEIDGAELNGQVLVTLPYDPTKLPADASEESVVVGHFAETLGEWVALTSYVDTEALTVSAFTSHFSIFNPFTWFSGNDPPVIADLRFEPMTYAVDCEALASQGQKWLTERPSKVVLILQDHDGLEDIEAAPTIRIRSDRPIKFDTETVEMEMEQVSPGRYEFSKDYSVGQGFFLALSEVLGTRCGNLRTLTATVRVRDSKGHRVEQSAIQDIRYEPVPEIVLDSPVSRAETDTQAPTLKWTIHDPQNALKDYESQKLTVSKDGTLKKTVLEANLPTSARDHFIQTNNTLEHGKTYYWQIELSKGTGGKWGKLHSQTGSFVVGGYFVGGKPADLAAELKVDGNRVVRSPVIGERKYDWLSWEVFRDGVQILGRGADNEMVLNLAEILRSKFTSGEYTVWLEAVVNNFSSPSGKSSVQISNEVSFVVQEPTATPTYTPTATALPTATARSTSIPRPTSTPVAIANAPAAATSTPNANQNGSASSCPKPVIKRFYSADAAEGSGARYSLYYEIENVNKAEIFGNQMELPSGKFDVYDGSNHWVLRAENGCGVIEKSIDVDANNHTPASGPPSSSGGSGGSSGGSSGDGDSGSSKPKCLWMNQVIGTWINNQPDSNRVTFKSNGTGYWGTGGSEFRWRCLRSEGDNTGWIVKSFSGEESEWKVTVWSSDLELVWEDRALRLWRE